MMLSKKIDNKTDAEHLADIKTLDASNTRKISVEERSLQW